MRRLISLLLVFTLTWVTTSYACRMDGGARARAVCCCPERHAAAKPAEAGNAKVVEAKSTCCDVSSSTAIDQQQPAIASHAPTFDLPAAAGIPVSTWNPTPIAARSTAAPPPARGPPGDGTRTYLATSRLRL